MNVLQSIALTVIVAGILVGAGWFLRGCVEAPDTDALAEAEAAEARADILEAQRDSAEAYAAERDSLALVESARADSLEAVSAAKDAALGAVQGELREAETHADELVARFGETGDVGDCADALDACSATRAANARVIDGLSGSLTTKAELLLVKDRQIEHLGLAKDSLFAAVGYGRLALDEQRVATELWRDQAHTYRWQRNAAVIGGGLLIVGILVLK